MALDVEPIWTALAARLADKTTSFVAVARRRPLGPFAPEQLPRLLVLDDQGNETLIGDPDDPAPVWRLSGEIVIVAKAQPADVDDKPTATLNDLVREVRTALEREPADSVANVRGPYVNLGGAVDRLAIVQVAKGVYEGQLVAKLDVEMDTNPL